MHLNETFIAVNKDGTICSPDESTFPILKQLENDCWQLIGTGFFITKNGIFLTAKHVLQDVLNANKQTHPIVAFLFPSQGIYQIRPILKGFLNVEGDVAAGIIQNKDPSGKLLYNPFYGLSCKEMRAGDKIVTCAYPETKHSGFDITFRIKFYNGEIQEYLSQGRDNVMLPNPCYHTSINILGGASGGPVFNSDGHVIGINSTGFSSGDLDHSPISFISDIKACFNIILEGINLPCGNYIERCTIEDLYKLGHVVVN